MRFANFQALFLLWLVPVVAVLSIAFDKRSQFKLKKAFGGKVAPFLTSSVSRPKRRIKTCSAPARTDIFYFGVGSPAIGHEQARGQSARH